MAHIVTFVVIPFILGAGMMLLLEVGRRIGLRRLRKNPKGAAKEGGAVEAAIFGLMGLLIAFTFSGAASRFDDRRHLITQEANAIGTFYLRLDLLPAESQSPLRDKMRQYLSSLLAGYGMAASGTRNWLHMLIFAAMLAIAVYVILDLEYPRFGLIRVTAADQILVDLRQSF